jgi:hypothetical protein
MRLDYWCKQKQEGETSMVNPPCPMHTYYTIDTRQILQAAVKRHQAILPYYTYI